MPKKKATPKKKAPAKKKKKTYQIKGNLRFDKSNKHRSVYMLEDAKGLLSRSVIHIDPKSLPQGIKAAKYSFVFELE